MRFAFLHKHRFVLAALLTALPLQQSHFANGITPEQVRATYILKMQPFFRVGSDAHAITKICYYERSGVPEEESVGQIIAKYYSQKPDGTTTVQNFTAIQRFTGCDLLYIPNSESNNVDNILAALGSNSTLTVSPAPQFIFKGGMIGFVLDANNRVKMEANRKNMKEKNIQANAQILEIMTQVVD